MTMEPFAKSIFPSPPLGRGRRKLRSPDVVAAAFLLAVLLVFHIELLRPDRRDLAVTRIDVEGPPPASLPAPRCLVPFDMGLRIQHYELERRSLLQTYGPATWNPYVGGGVPWASHPEAPFPAPTLALTLLLGTVYGLKVSLFIYALAGSLGLFFLCRRFCRLSTGAALFAALVLGTADWLPGKAAQGVIEKAPLLLSPWLLLVLAVPADEKNAKISWSRATLGALLILPSLFGGKFAVLAISLFALAVLLVGAAGDERARDGTGEKRFQRGASLGTLAAALLLAAGLGAVKLLPVLGLALTDAREAASYADTGDHYGSLPDLFAALLAGARYPFGEKALGAGPAALLLALVAVAFDFRRCRRWLVSTFLFTLIVLGPATPLDLSRLLWRLPGFSSVYRWADYFGLPLLVSLCVLAAIGLERLVRVGGVLRHAPAAAVLVHLLYLVINPFGANRYGDVFRKPLPPSPAAPGGFYQVRGKVSETLNLLAGIGSLDWSCEIGCRPTSAEARYVLEEGRLKENGSYRGEARIASGEGTARLIEIGPGYIELSVAGSTPLAVVVNQNHHRWWSASEGEVREAAGGLLGLLLEGGPERRIALRFRAWDMRAGATVSLITAAVLIFIRMRRGKGRKRQDFTQKPFSVLQKQ